MISTKAVMDAVATPELQQETVHGAAYEAMTAAQVEIRRLRSIIDRAKQESELIQYGGKSVLVIPYWFMKS